MSREERVSLEAYRCLYDDAREVGGAVVLRSPGTPDSPMLNRVVGLGVDEPASAEGIDAALAAMGGDVTFYVAVSPSSRPAAELVAWLGARGLVPGWGWMLFRRSVDDAPAAPAPLRVVEVRSPAEADVFGQVVVAGYELPRAGAPWAASARERGWSCWLALAGDEPAAAAALFVAGGAGYLGFAATLPEHRRKGAQNALLSTRIRRAHELGCDVVVTETGEWRPDRPSNSYRNIVRAGFEEVAVTANWLHRREAALPGRGAPAAQPQPEIASPYAAR